MRAGASNEVDVELASPRMQEIIELLRRLASSPSTPVFLQGPSGVGKRHLAVALHRLTFADAQPAPFVELACAAFPDALVEDRRHRGFVEPPLVGTLFLDEVTGLSPRSQAELLAFLDGARLDHKRDGRFLDARLRVVATTSRAPDELATAPDFNRDLYHSLAVFMVQIPGLCTRPSDVRELACTFARFFSTRIRKRTLEPSSAALDALSAYSFPGNVRELRNIMERAVVMAVGSEVSEHDLVLPLNTPAWRRPDDFLVIRAGENGRLPSLDDVEQAYVLRVLEHFEGHRTLAARALDISYPTLLRRLRP